MEENKDAAAERLRKEAAIKRLRKSKLETEEHDSKRGAVDGATWADECAEYSWLRYLAEECPAPEEMPEPFDLLRSAIDPENEMHPAELQETCFRDEKRLSKEYIVSFINGAAARYNELSDEL